MWKGDTNAVVNFVRRVKGHTRSEGVTEASRNVLGAQGEPSAERRSPSGGPTAYLAKRCAISHQTTEYRLTQ